jgi:hypothetical protein
VVGLHCRDPNTNISVFHCNITNNTKWGIYCDWEDGNLDAGGGYMASPGNNVIRNNSDWDFINASPYDIKAKNNYWDHATVTEIDVNDIYDDDENASFGVVDFDPFLTTTRSALFLMKPRLLSTSSLFADFFRSLFRSDLPTSAIYISPSFKSKLHITRFDLISAGYHLLTAERYYPPLMLRTGR